MKFAVEDPDAPENWPRMWIIWRGNALMSSAKGMSISSNITLAHTPIPWPRKPLKNLSRM